MTKNILILTLGLLVFGMNSTQALATQGYMNAFDLKYKAASYNCSICHQQTTGRDLPVTKPFSSTYLYNYPEVKDSDFDGILDVFEIRMGADMNLNTDPILATLDTAEVTADNSVLVIGTFANVATRITSAPTPTVTLSTGQKVMGGISISPILSLPQEVRIAFRDDPVDAAGTVNVYDMSQAGAQMNYVVESDGSILVTTTSALPELVVASTVKAPIYIEPTINPAPSTNTSSDSGGGCLSKAGNFGYLLGFLIFSTLLLRRKEYPS